MAGEGTCSKFARIARNGSKACLILGAAFLLLAYRDVNLKERGVAELVDSFEAKLEEHQPVLGRFRRGIGFDSAFQGLYDRLSSLENRFNQSSAFETLGMAPYAALLPFLRGPQGPQGEKGEKGEPGPRGFKGNPGWKGEEGRKGDHTDSRLDLNGSSVYIRWGKSSCPEKTEAKLAYSGFAAGQHYSHSGGMSNTLCLHSNPKFGSYSDSADTLQWIYSVEYEVSSFNPFTRPLHNHDAPCAVCHVETRGTELMIPGRITCPAGWTREYSGYLMSEQHASKGRTSAVCVDEDAEALPGTFSDGGGSLWYLVQGSSAPYVGGREISCVVCTQ